MAWLKQSTAANIKIGPFVDETNGRTPESALTIAQADVELAKNGGTLAQKNDTGSCTADGTNGYYTCPINGTDTGTLGVLLVTVDVSGALPVRHEYTVVPAEAYDALVLGTDNITSDLTSGAITSIGTEVDSSLATYDSPTKTEMDTAFTEIKGATWASGSDTLEHIRDKQTDIEADTQDLQTQIGTAGAGLTAVDGISATGMNEIADAILDRATAIDGFTPRQLLAAIAAAVAAKLSGAAGTAITIRSVDDNHDRITATVDADGNRTAVTISTTGIV